MTISTMCNRIGFSKHASEFWLLAKLMMDRITASKSPEPSGPSAGLGLESSLVVDDSTEPILHEYDQTSMQQVNDLIVTLQQIHIQ